MTERDPCVAEEGAGVVTEKVTDVVTEKSDQSGN